MKSESREFLTEIRALMSNRQQETSLHESNQALILTHMVQALFISVIIRKVYEALELCPSRVCPQLEQAIVKELCKSFFKHFRQRVNAGEQVIFEMSEHILRYECDYQHHGISEGRFYLSLFKRYQILGEYPDVQSWLEANTYIIKLALSFWFDGDHPDPDTAKRFRDHLNSVDDFAELSVYLRYLAQGRSQHLIGLIDADLLIPAI